MVKKRSWEAYNEGNANNQHQYNQVRSRPEINQASSTSQEARLNALKNQGKQGIKIEPGLTQRNFSQPKDIFDAYSDSQRKSRRNETVKPGDKPQSTAATPLDRVSLFVQLSYELEHDPAFIQEFRKIAGEEGSNQALSFAKDVNSQKGILAAIAQEQQAILPHETTTPKPCPTLSAWFDQYPDHLPALPSILDAEMEAKVFTAPSFIQYGERSHLSSYERLEWLGDAYLELITRRIVFNIVTDTSEALPSTITQDFVRNENLARYALAYGFDERLRISSKHLANTVSSTRKAMTKVYGDIFEAYIAALIESDPVSGYKTAYAWLSTLIKPTILKYTNRVPINPLAKEELAKKILGKGIQIEWEEHQKPTPVKGGTVYYYSAFLTGWGYQRQLLGSGQGPSKSQAQILAAMEALTNPTTAIICAVKREYDALVKIEREREGGPDAEVIAVLDKRYKEIFVE